MATRKELIETLRARYRGAAQAEKTKILDELAALTGYHRKHAVRVLLGVHSVRIFADGWRTATIARIGVLPCKGIYTVLSIAGFVVLVRGYARRGNRSRCGTRRRGRGTSRRC